MRRRPAALALPVLVAVVAATGACGSGDGEDGPPAAARRPMTTTTRATTAAPAGAPGPAAPSGPAPTASSRAATATAPSPPPPAPAGARFSAAGTYRYAATGRFTGPTGAEPRDGETTLAVDAPTGADQRSVRRSPGGRSVEQVLRFAGDGAYLVALRQTEQGVVKEVRPSPPALAFPWGAAAGRSWSWRATSTDGRTNVDAGFRVVRTEDVPVGAEQVPAVVVEAVVSTTGDVVSTSRQTLWVSERHRLVVRVDEATEGSLGTLAFSSSSSERLLSTAPA